MSDQFIQLPDDSGNSGKKVRTQRRTVGANTVDEHYMIITDEVNDRQAAVSANGLEVEVKGSLPAGTAAIGKLAANSGVDIGDVDIISSALPTGAATAANQQNDGLTDAELRATAVPISAAALPLPSGAATSGNQQNDALTDTELRANAVPVSVASLPLPSGAATAANQQSDALTDTELRASPVTVDLGANNDVEVSGDIAHDAVDSGKPVKIGGKAAITNPTAVAHADRVDAMFDDQGRQVVVTNHVRDLTVHQYTQISSSSSETTILTAGAAGVFHDLIHLVITNETDTAVTILIKDNTAGTTRINVALAPLGGAVIPYPTPFKQALAADNWTATLSNATTVVNFTIQAVKNL